MSMSTALFSLPAAAVLQSELAARLPDFGMLRWAEETGSTNADLMLQAREAQAPALPWLLGAHLQVQGRGRAGRPWNAAPGAALMLSCAFETTAAPAQLPSLSLVAGIAACEALRRHAGDNAGQVLMKWPNDLQYGDAKLAGILVETSRQPATGKRIVVMGMGLNLRDAAAISQHFGRAVADWSQIRGGFPACTQDWLDMASTLAADIAQAWQAAVRLHEAEGFQAFLARHATMDALAQRQVNVLEDGRQLLSGTAAGLDELGRLLVRHEHGLDAITVGEISVRART
ncbi:biotin--[acetyl-CoA-carboxylase] ligase [Kerstersia sp.]|uniref:biotin--[acetyl-CoA-carboxylase] ligase n=1 Tax=Kerstersia sp. TaxID=1930783 RepID=UPI003F92D00A